MIDLTPLEEIVADPYNLDYLIIAYHSNKKTELAAAVIEGLGMIINNNKDIISCKGLLEDEERIEAEENLEMAIHYITLLHQEGLEAYISELKINKSDCLRKLMGDPYSLVSIIEALSFYKKDEIMGVLTRSLKLSISTDAEELLDPTLSDFERAEAQLGLNLNIELLKVLQEEGIKTYINEIAKIDLLNPESIN